MPWYAFLLYPFALLYEFITGLRNKFFDLGWLKSVKSPISTIIVGNLSVGGTGKTPMVEWIIRLLKDENNLSILSRGYRRKSNGFLQASPTTLPAQLGDEPFQIFRKFGNEVKIFVGEDRVEALKKIANNSPETQLVILDDAMQHRYHSPDFTILLTTFQKPFFTDFLLPMGRLRESRRGAKRADVIVVTKCPAEISNEIKHDFQAKMSPYLRSDSSVIFASIEYAIPYPLEANLVFSPRIILLSGLADDQQLVGYVSSNYEVLSILKYPDHHEYDLPDFETIKKVFLSFEHLNPVILTTEKDAVKVKSNAPKDFLKEIPIFVLPIAVKLSPEDRTILIDQIYQKVLKNEI
jgi:tetraacyldisaccharide 4'-kinase